MKQYRIKIEMTGDSPIVYADSPEEAEEQYIADVTGDELLQRLVFTAEEIRTIDKDWQEV